MGKPLFFQHNHIYYNFSQIIRFNTIGTTHFITMSDGEILEINIGHLNFSDIILVVNPFYGDGYKSYEDDV